MSKYIVCTFLKEYDQMTKQGNLEMNRRIKTSHL